MNLENLNVQELNTEDQKNVDGGLNNDWYTAWNELKIQDFILNGITWP